MRSMKKGLAISLSMALAFSALPAANVDAAKKPALSKKTASVKVGKTIKISVKNAKKTAKVTWKTSKKTVAKITKSTKKGNAYAKIKGVKAGKATITATVKQGSRKVLKCKVTVKKAATAPTVTAAPAPGNTATTAPGSTATTAPGNTATTAPGDHATAAPTDTPEPTVKPTIAPTTQNYSYFDDYTLGYNGAIKAYVKGSTKGVNLADANVPLYNLKTDNIFGQHIANNNWYDDKITLTAPSTYTTNDGKVNQVDSTLTDFNFVADPTAIDNSENDGKLYVYGTTEGIDYKKGVLDKNGYNNHSLTVLSTSDMVNWTDEGFLDTQNLTNLPDSAKKADKVKAKWATKAWAPSGLKYDGDGDGDDEYYLFYTNSGAVGYSIGETPNGPWTDYLDSALFTQGSPNCSGVVWCFDPAVLVDNKNNAYIYFGGGTTDDKAHGKTARVCKIKFEQGTGKVLMDGDPQVLDNYYMFEDSEINQFGDKYFYSYCTNFNVPGTDPYTHSGEIACYVSTDPMDISFAPENNKKFTDEKTGVYHHYLGTILKNPSVIYGESYNNHHHMQTFKGHDYIFYHSTFLSNQLFRSNKQYRNLHVDEISVDRETDEIKIEPTYKGADQIEDFNPYTNFDKSVKYINATTAAKSAGVNSFRDDTMAQFSINGSPMVLNNIDTGDWTMIKGVDFGEKGAKSLTAEMKADFDVARIEVFLDDPTDLKNRVGIIEKMEPTKGFEFLTTTFDKAITGKHNVYFVFRGDKFQIASWIFSETEKPVYTEKAAGILKNRPVPPEVDPSNPTPDTPTPSPATTGWNADKTVYTLELNEDNVKGDGTGTVSIENGTAICEFPNEGYPGVWFQYPETEDATFSKVIFKYKDNTTGGCGSAVRYAGDTADKEINWGGKLPDAEGEETISLAGTDPFDRLKIFRNDAKEPLSVTITSVQFVK